MSTVKRERGGAVSVELDLHEAAVVRGAFAELLVLLAGRGDEPTEPAAEIAPGVLDPFAGDGQTQTPEDPALARLLPDAYADDPEAAADFRRFTESDLLAGKRANIATLLDSLGEGGQVRLERAELHAWVVALNDLRLTLGARLEIEDDYLEVAAALEPTDPRLPAFYLYEWLTGLQDALVRAQR